MFKGRRRSSNAVYFHSASRNASGRRSSRDKGDEERHGQGGKERKSEWFVEDVEDGEISPGWRPSEPGGGGFEFTVRPFTSRQRLMPKSTTPAGTEWKSVADEDEEGNLDEQRFSLVSIMEPSKRDLPIDLKRMSMLWTHGNIFRALPSPTTNSPPSTPDTEVPPTQTIPLTPTRAPRLDISTTTITVHSPSPSPISAVASASATWSILEMYGVSPESPMTERAPPGQQHLAKQISSPFLQVPSAPNAPSLSIAAQPSSDIPPVPPIPKHLRSGSQRSIRPLPAVPSACPSSTSKHVPPRAQIARIPVLHGPRPRSNTLPTNRRPVIETIQMPSPSISYPGGHYVASTPESATRRLRLPIRTGDQRN